MAFPRKFKALLETRLKGVEAPDYAGLVYAVCAVRKTSCGWGGWILDGAFRKSRRKLNTSTGDKLLPSTMGDRCPRCGNILFGTSAEIMVQRRGRIRPLRFKYVTMPLEFEL